MFDTAVTTTPKTNYEVADILRQHGYEYGRKHHLSLEQRQVIRDLTECRTAVLGGHVDLCDHCSGMRIAYNSCRNRHCPKCGSVVKAEWVQKQKSHLLPTHYFHVVFTIDHAFLPLVRVNPQRLYELLIRSAASSLKEMGQRHLGGEVGIMTILHTWGQQLTEHPHVHCLVTGGALSKDGKRWRQSKPDFLFPIEALSRLFKERFCQGVEKLYRQKRLTFAGLSLPLAAPEAMADLLHSAREKKWHVYAKAPFADAEQVVDYLGRYTNRIAISNYRIKAVEHDRVSFRYRDYQDGGREKQLTLEVDEFIRRFLLHVLPWGFVRIRYYGLLATGQRARKLAICRRLLFVLDSHEAQPQPQLSRLELIEQMLGRHADRCPACNQGTYHRFRQLLPHPSRQAWLQAVRG